MKSASEILACRSCKRWLQLGMFWPQVTKKNGRQSECKDCMRKRNNQWHRDHPEKARRGVTQSRQNNPVAFMVRSARSRAKLAGLECTITVNDIVIPLRCPVLGIELRHNVGWGKGIGLAVRDACPSIDRIDNRRGYTPDNIVIVSYRANRIKSDATLGELQKLVTFYERIIREGNRRSGERWCVSEEPVGQPPISMSTMQPPPEKEAREVSLAEM